MMAIGRTVRGGCYGSGRVAIRRPGSHAGSAVALTAMVAAFAGCTQPANEYDGDSGGRADVEDDTGGAADSGDDAALPDVDRDGMPSEPDYDGTCSGHPFRADCSGAECATSERAAHYLELWWQAMIDGLDAPEDVVRSELEVTLAEIVDGPVWVGFHVQFVVHVDWVRSRQNTNIGLGDYPLASYPDDATVLSGLRAALRCTHLPTHATSFEEMMARARWCHPDATIDICHLHSLDWCAFLATGGAVLDYAANRCLEVRVDLESDLVDRCGEAPCWVE